MKIYITAYFLLFYLSYAFAQKTDSLTSDKEVNEAVIESVELVDSVQYKKVLHLLKMGDLEFDAANYIKALEYYVQAMELDEELYGQEHEYYIYDLVKVGESYQELGNYETALSLFEKGRSLIQRVFGQKTSDYPSILNHIARVNMDMEERKKAIVILDSALEICAKNGECNDMLLAYIYNNLSIAYYEEREFEKALPYYLKTLDLLENSVGKEDINYTITLSNLANLYVDMGKVDEAMSIYLEIENKIRNRFGEDHPYYAKSLNNRALLLYEIDEYEIALDIYKEVNEIVWSNLSRNFVALSSEEKEHYFSSQDFVLNNFNLLVGQSGEKGKSFREYAYDNILRYKNLILNTELRLRENLEKYGSEDDLMVFEKWQEAITYLSDQFSLPTGERDPNLDSVKVLVNRYERDLSRISAEFDRFQKDQQVRMKDVQSHLKPGEIAIEFVKYWDYLDSINFYDALVLMPDKEYPFWIRLCKEDDINDRLVYKRERKADYVSRIYSVGRRGLRPQEKEEKTIYQLIWKPLDSLLSGVTKIYYSPAGLLHKINISALPVNRDTTLGDRYQLIRLSSTGKIIEREGYVRDNTAIVLSDIDYDYHAALEVIPQELTANDTNESEGFAAHFRGAGMSSLPWEPLYFTAEEGEEISEILSASEIQCSYFNREKALEERIKEIGENAERSPRVIHFATHGYFFADDEAPSESYKPSTFYDAEDPMFRSGLILAGANGAWTGSAPSDGKQDGILSAREISLLDLKETELVVMSACETGLGRIKDMEGVYGLQRAFKLAGVRYLIMSLWQVPDYQSKDLMVTFYSYWLEDGLPIPKAFRKAQQEMKTKYRDPYFWAGFVLME